LPGAGIFQAANSNLAFENESEPFRFEAAIHLTDTALSKIIQ
jgi:hypothetical protein